MTTRTRLSIVALLAFLLPAFGVGLVVARQGADAPADRNVSALASAVVVPFEMLPSNHMIVEAKLNGEGPFRLIFDVGSPVTLISNRASNAANLFDENAPRAFLFGARGEAEVDRLEVGELTTEAVPVIVMDHPVVKALGQLLGKPIDGLVGHSFFARYKTTIDYQAKTMAFEPVEHEIRDFLRDLPQRLTGPKIARRVILAPSGLFGFSVGEPVGDDAPGVPLASVLPDSPASDAGLEVGDILTTLDGRWVTSVADAYTAAGAVEPGVEVEVVILRDGQEITLTLTPKPGI